MALQDLLRNLGLFLLPTTDMDRILSEYEAIKYRAVRSYLAASLAEVLLFTAGIQDSLQWPLEFPPGLLEIVKYKCNTITYSCGYHKGEIKPRSEYIFFFSSDCWKLREILRGEEPFPMILDDPFRVRNAILESGWKLVPEGHDSKNVVPDLAILLWHAKAYALANPDAHSDKVSKTAESLFEKMDIKLRLR